MLGVAVIAKPRDGCFRCGDLNHLARNCPRPVTSGEAHGKTARSTALRTNVVTTSPTFTELTKEQLKEMLTKRRLEKEQSLLKQAYTSTTPGVQAVTATCNSCMADAVGLTPCLPINIEEVSITALASSLFRELSSSLYVYYSN